MTDVGIRVELDGAKEASADLDTLGSKIDNLNKKVVDTSKAAPAASASVDDLTKKLGGLLGSLDPAYAAGQKFAEGQRTLKAALDAGLITQAQYTANLAKLPTAFDSAAKSAGEFGATVGKLGAAAAVAFAAFEIHTINVADKFNDMSQKLGISVHDLAEFDVVGKQTGVGMDNLAQGVKALSKNMIDNGATFRAAGITATNAHDAMVQLSDIFSHMPDGIEKTTLANRLFGRSGQDLIPLLNLGSAGLQSSAAAAKEYAEAMAKLAPLADQLKDEIAMLEVNVSTLAISIGNDLVPWLLRMSEELNKAIELAGGFSNALFVIGTSDPFGTSAEHVKKYREEIEGLEKDKARLLGFNDTAGAASLQQAIDTATIRKKFYEYRQQQEALAGSSPYRNEGAGSDPAQLAEWKRRADLLAKIGAPKGPKNPDDTEWASIQNKVRAEDFGVSAQSMKDLDLIAKLFDAGKISADQYNSSLKTILDTDTVLKGEEAEHARQIKKDMADRVAAADNMFGMLSEKSQDYQAQVQLGLISESEAREKLYADRVAALPVIDEELEGLRRMADGNEELTKKVIQLQKEEAKLRAEIAATALTFEQGFNKAARDYVNTANDAAKAGAQLANGIFAAGERQLEDFFMHGKMNLRQFVTDVELEFAKLASKKIIGAIVDVLFPPDSASKASVGIGEVMDPIKDAFAGLATFVGGIFKKLASSALDMFSSIFPDMGAKIAGFFGMGGGTGGAGSAIGSAAGSYASGSAGALQTVAMTSGGTSTSASVGSGGGFLSGASTASSIMSAMNGGYDTATWNFANSSFGQSVGLSQQIGVDQFGNAVNVYSAAGQFMHDALPYAGAAIQALQGDYKGAAFTAAGTYIGSYFGGPVGGAIGGAIGNMVGGMFGGGGEDPHNNASISGLEFGITKRGLFGVTNNDGVTGPARLTAGKTSGSGWWADNSPMSRREIDSIASAAAQIYQRGEDVARLHGLDISAIDKVRVSSLVNGVPSPGGIEGYFSSAQQALNALSKKIEKILNRAGASLTESVGAGGSLMAGQATLDAPRRFGFGDEFMVSRPTLFIAGDSGTEQVSISPAAGAARNGRGGGNQVLNFNGPVLFDTYSWNKFKREMGL